MTMLDERPATARPNPDSRPGSLPDARRTMIDSQLRVSGVNDPAVIAAMARVPREDFVPAAQRDSAYIDRALPLGNGHALPAPLVHGRMLMEASVQAEERVLVVSPCGYLAALVRELGGKVTERTPADAAAKKSGGPFDLILIDGAAEVLPDTLARVLAADGRVVTGLLVRGVSRLAVGRKGGDGIALLTLAEIGIPAVPEFAAAKSWSF